MPQRSIQLESQRGPFPINWPMGLTMLRLLLLPVFLYLLLMDTGRPPPHPHRWWALGVFAIMAITDKLDGYLARKLNQSTHLGAILDPLADKLLVASSVVLLNFDWVAGQYAIPLWVVAAIYAKDVIVALGTVAMLVVVGKVTVRARPAGKVSTVVQLVLVMATLLGPELALLGADFVHVVLTALWWSVTAVAAAACGDYLAQGFKAFFESRAGGAGQRDAKAARA